MKLNTPTRMATTFKVRGDADDGRTLTFQIATERVALDRGIILADGADFSRYTGDAGNPIVLLGHDHGEPFGHTTRIARNAQGWEADVQVSPDDELSPAGQRWFRRLKRLGRGAASVGFTVDDSRAPSEVERRTHGDRLEWVGTKWTLLEWSIVAVGADPGALMHSATDEGRAFRRAMADVGFERFTEDEQSTAQTARADAPSAEGEAPVDPVLAALQSIESKVDQLIEMAMSDTAADAMETETETQAAPRSAWAEALRIAAGELRKS